MNAVSSCDRGEGSWRCPICWQVSCRKDGDGESAIEMVEDDTELAAVGKVFAELAEATDIEYER